MENELNKQTAVEWLVEKLQESGIPLMTDEFEMIKKAKQMEKKQIIDAYFGGWHREFGNRDEDSQQYYEQTYGGNK
jgi:hypothetical protein